MKQPVSNVKACEICKTLNKFSFHSTLALISVKALDKMRCVSIYCVCESDEADLRPRESGKITRQRKQAIRNDMFFSSSSFEIDILDEI